MEGLAGLEEGVHGTAAAGGAGDLGILRGFLMQGGGLDVDDAVETEGGEGEAAGEDALDFVLRVEVSGEAGVEGIEFFEGFGGEAHVFAQQTMAGVVEAGAGFALGRDGSAG